MVIFFAVATLIGLGGLALLIPREVPKVFATGIFIVSLAALALVVTT